MKVQCAVCGNVFRGRVPKGGDGSALVPYPHKWNGQKCTGQYLPGKEIDPLTTWERKVVEQFPESASVIASALPNNPLQERVEKVFDQVFIELAGLSNSVEEYEELKFDYEDSEAWEEVQKEFCVRYDRTAGRMRDLFTKLRRELMDALK